MPQQSQPDHPGLPCTPPAPTSSVPFGQSSSSPEGEEVRALSDAPCRREGSGHGPSALCLVFCSLFPARPAPPPSSTGSCRTASAWTGLRGIWSMLAVPTLAQPDWPFRGPGQQQCRAQTGGPSLKGNSPCLARSLQPKGRCALLFRPYSDRACWSLAQCSLPPPSPVHPPSCFVGSWVGLCCSGPSASSASCFPLRTLGRTPQACPAPNWAARKLRALGWRGIQEGGDLWGRGTGQLQKPGRQSYPTPFKPVRWASVSPGRAYFNLFERNSACIFTAVSCIFYL